MLQAPTRKKVIEWVAFALLLIAAVGCTAFYLGRTHSAAVPVSGIVLDQNAEAWQASLPSAGGTQTGIQIPGFSEITVANGSSRWDITLYNPEGNPCCFQYSVRIGEEETALYESGLIEPGKAISSFEVDRALPTGDYELHLVISTYSLDDSRTRMNGANVKAVLHVV